MQQIRKILSLLLILFLLPCIAGCNLFSPIDLQIPAETPINYNNYSDYCCFDSRNDHFIRCNLYFPGNAILQTPDNSTSIVSAESNVQLTDSYLYYIRNYKLMRRNLSSGKTNTIASNVSSYLALEDTIYYISIDFNTYQSSLVKYDLSTDNCTTLICDEDLSIESINYHDGHFYALLDDYGTERLLRFDDAGAYTTVCAFEITSFPYNAQISRNFLLYDSGNSLVFVNLTSGARNTISISERAHAIDSLVYICNDNHVFVSFQATKTDGSFVSDIDHADNGLYHINPQTRERTKLSSETFDVLYLFSDDILIGNQNGKWVKIDTHTGITTPL